MSGEITVKTNNQFRNVLSWHELTAKERKEFDYLLTSEMRSADDAEFVRYRGVTYDLGEFMAFEAKPAWFKGWDGYFSDSYFSGVLVKWSSDFEQVKMGTYYS